MKKEILKTVADYEKAVNERLDINGKYTIRDGNLYRRGGGKNDESLIANGFVYLDKTIVDADGNARDYIVIINGVTNAITKTEITGKDIDKIGSYINIDATRTAMGHIKSTITTQRDYVPRINAVTETGFHEINGKEYFCLPGGCYDTRTAEKTDNVICELKNAPDLNDILGFNDEELNPDALKELWRVIPDKKLISTLPYSISLIVSHICPKVTPRYSLYYEGKTKSGKTTLAAANSCLFGNFTRDNFRGATLDTANYFEMYMHSLKDLCAVLDDVHPNETASARAESQNKLEQLIRSVANKQERGRANRDAEIGNVYSIQSNMLITGEFNPLTVQSSLNRLVIIKFDKDMTGDDYDVIDRNKPQINAFGREILFQITSKPRKEYSEYIANRFEQNKARLNAIVPWANISEHVIIMRTIWDLIIDFLIERNYISEEEKQKLNEVIDKVLLELWHYNADIEKAADPALLILNFIQAQYGAATGYYLANNHNDFEPENRDKNCFGFRNRTEEKNEIWLHITDITNAWNAAHPATKYSQKQIGILLKEAGYSTTARTGEWFKKHPGGDTRRYIVIDNDTFINYESNIL